MLLTAEIVPTVVATGASARVHEHVAPRFRAGDRVRVRNLNRTTHTRLPRYIRDKVGIVEFDYGVFAFPDTNAHGQGEHPQHCYRVRFTAPVPAGARVRLRQKLVKVEPVEDNGFRVTSEMTMEVEGNTRPAMVAETLGIIYA